MKKARKWLLTFTQLRCRDRLKNLAYVVLEDPDVADGLISGRHGDLVLANYSRPIPSSLFR
jgi:hypothetical protein